MKTLFLVFLLLTSFYSFAEVKFTPEQCIFLYGNTAAVLAVNRDEGVSFEKAKKEYDSWLVTKKLDPKREDVRIYQDLIFEVYGGLSRKTPTEILELKSKECINNKGVVHPHKKV